MLKLYLLFLLVVHKLPCSDTQDGRQDEVEQKLCHFILMYIIQMCIACLNSGKNWVMIDDQLRIIF